MASPKKGNGRGDDLPALRAGPSNSGCSRIRVPVTCFGVDDRSRDRFVTRREEWVEGIRRGDFLPWRAARSVTPATSGASPLPVRAAGGEEIMRELDAEFDRSRCRQISNRKKSE